MCFGVVCFRGCVFGLVSCLTPPPPALPRPLSPPATNPSLPNAPARPPHNLLQRREHHAQLLLALRELPAAHEVRPEVGHHAVDDQQLEGLVDHPRSDAREQVELCLVRVGARVEDLGQISATAGGWGRACVCVYVCRGW